MDGMDLFRAFNLARTAQGLPWASAVPAHTTRAANDTLTLISSAPYIVSWTRTGPAPGAAYAAIWYSMAVNTIPRTLDSTRKLRMIGSTPITPGGTVNINPLLTSSKQFWPGCVINLAAAIAEAGDCPFTMAYLSFRFTGL